MAANVELSGVSVVSVGTFNPAIFQPNWLAQNGLLAAGDAEHALEDLVVTQTLTAFTGGWLTAQITVEQAIFSTIEEARELELRDLATNIFELLPHTPVNAIGINMDSHFRVESEDAWHEMGDTFLPKDRWEPLFAVEGEEWVSRESGLVTGLRAMMVEAWRPNRRDYVRVEVAPSTRITPNGVFVGINSHFQLTYDEQRGTALDAARVVADNWDEVRGFERTVRDGILEWVR